MKKQLFIFCAALCSISALAQTLPAYLPTAGLIGWWPFNGNANDESGNSNNGTVNGATLTADRNSNLNSAYNFSGNNNFITINSSSSLNINGSLSISIWIQSTDYNNPDQQIFWRGDNQSSRDPYFVFISSNGTAFRRDCGAGAINNLISFDNSNITNQSAFQHIVAIFDSTANTMSLFLNGNSVISQVFANNTINYSTSNFVNIIGAALDANGSTQYFAGKIDDIGIWNRALTQQEINSLYTGCGNSITSQPINQTVVISNSAQFTTATSDPNATYQWQTNLGVGFQNLSNVGQYSGVTSNTLTITNTTLINNNQPFRCLINSGACSDTTSIATLNLCGAITTQPTNQVVNITSNAQFITTSSDPLATYYWQTDLGIGFQNLSNVGQYSGATTNTLTITNTSLTNNNQPFRCLINSGACSDTTNTAILTVSNNVSLNELYKGNSFTIYPNPATSQVTILADVKLIGSVFTVYNYIGKSVFVGKINSENTLIDLEDLSGGIYLISIGDNIKQTFKVIKQ